MPRKASLTKPAKRVTKSIRLTTEEAEDLAQLVTGTAYAEAALLRQWVLAGMQQFRIVEATRLYQDGYIGYPLGSGAGTSPRCHLAGRDGSAQSGDSRSA